MKRVLPNSPGRLLAMLGLFVVVAVSGWSADKRVWVQYAPGAKGNVVSALAKAGGHVHYEFDNINAVAVTLPEQALSGISHNPQVALVEEDPVRVMMSGGSQQTPYGVPMVQSFEAQTSGGTGSGITIGVIDSGVYIAHPDLPAGKISGYPKYSGNDERNWDRDIDSHGTHVVGTICAVDNTEGVIGVAPGVGSIYMVKVFGDTGNWVYSSTLLAAVQYAVSTGHAKIISMSLGGGTKSRTEETGLNSLYNSGTLLIAAAGNAGNTTTSYPAGYSSVVSVAAIDSNKVVADFSQKNSTVELSAPGVGVLSTVSYVDVTTLTVDGANYASHFVEFAARGSRSGTLVYGGLGTSTDASWSGKVVLVDRGTNSFYEKVHNVQLSGGGACIIANNTTGDLYATLGDGNSSTIPAVGITQADGATLKTKLGTSATVTSTFSQPAAGYDYFDGTSMATPHVSAVAALVWSSKLTATNKQVRQALTDTAEDLGTGGRDNSYGFGLVRANNAITRLAAIVGGGSGGGGDITAPVVSNLTVAAAKGKAGAFTVSFKTNEAATGLVVVDGLGSATTPLGTTHSVKVQGTKGVHYTGYVTATDAAGNTSDPQTWSFTP